ncbi:hypothetical protein GA0115240_17161 [Streptomyces sp. DvalAA-14]|nr:hypothetical protein GA0115240_17161 [Streptomyces sp. DvalAA-14]
MSCAASTRCSSSLTWPLMQRAYTAKSMATLVPAHSATCAGGTPLFSHVVKQVCRRS